MSEPFEYPVTRWTKPDWLADNPEANLVSNAFGQWVSFHDFGTLWNEYARLKAELERLKNTDPNSISGSTIMSDPSWSIACFRFHRENERAEIARLRKAGDNLERVLTTKVASYEVANASHEWRAAKEGKQP